MGKLLNANAGASSSCLRVGGVSITSKIGTQHFCGCQLPQDAELRERDRHTQSWLRSQLCSKICSSGAQNLNWTCNLDELESTRKSLFIFFFAQR